MAQRYTRIFAALDGASTQEAVAERAVALAADDHAELVFGHVIDSVPFEASGVDFEALCTEGKKRIEADLADILAEATGAACVQVIGRKFVLFKQKDKDSAFTALLAAASK